jgi:hypothetical protein
MGNNSFKGMLALCSCLAVGTCIGGESLLLFVKGVDREWNVKKQASRFCRVGPVGILYMGYHATEIQLAGVSSQLLQVLSCGN